MPVLNEPFGRASVFVVVAPSAWGLPRLRRRGHPCGRQDVPGVSGRRRTVPGRRLLAVARPVRQGRHVSDGGVPQGFEAARVDPRSRLAADLSGGSSALGGEFYPTARAERKVPGFWPVGEAGLSRGDVRRALVPARRRNGGRRAAFAGRLRRLGLRPSRGDALTARGEAPKRPSDEADRQHHPGNPRHPREPADEREGDQNDGLGRSLLPRGDEPRRQRHGDEQDQRGLHGRREQSRVRHHERREHAADRVEPVERASDRGRRRENVTGRAESGASDSNGDCAPPGHTGQPAQR